MTRAGRAVAGLGTPLVRAGASFVVEARSATAGCAGWRRRRGFTAARPPEPELLDPAREPARSGAVHADPSFARRGVGRLILRTSEAAAREAVFSAVELMATRARLYRVEGHFEIERLEVRVEGVAVPLIRMRCVRRCSRILASGAA